MAEGEGGEVAEDTEIDEDTEPETRDEQVNKVDGNIKHYTNQYYNYYNY